MRLSIFAPFALLAACALAQGPAGSLLIVETANHTGYVRDVTDYSLLATKPGPTTGTSARNFDEGILIGDIVSVNGKPAKGTVVETATTLNLRPSPTPGQAIADITRTNRVEWLFEIQGEDGRPIGSILVKGMTGGPPPPGQTQQIRQASYIVVGGNGAFLGVRGYMGAAGATAGIVSPRAASVAEDPADRRMFPGGSIRQGIYLLPMTTPEIVTTTGGPAIVHASDYSLVTTAKPAKSGEILSLFASGLGPTRPGVEPGEPFPAQPLLLCNSPIEVLVGGKPGEVLYAGGYPGAVDRYQVNFRVPDGIASGAASVQLTSAWIGGGQVTMAIQ